MSTDFEDKPTTEVDTADGFRAIRKPRGEGSLN
jgi:hypothetical protein